MARITRKFLKALSIEDENVQEQIINAYREEIDTLTEERDTFKVDAEKLPKVEKELNDLKEAHKDNGENPYQKKYEDEHKAFEAYKKEVTAKETKAAKKTAYKALLKETGINEKRIDSILKVTDVDKIELDDDGNIKDSETLKNNIKTEWADFIVQTSTQGANTATPPANSGGNSMTKEQIRAIKDPIARQKAMAENKELFGLS